MASGGLLSVVCACFALTVVGGVATLDERRPYELVRANRRTDFTPPVADVTDPALWTLETESAQAAFSRTDERLLFGEGLGQLEWTALGTNPVVRLRLKRPVRLAEDFDFASVWVYGDMVKSKPVAERPAVTLRFGDWREAARKVQIPFLTYRGYGRVSRPYVRLGSSGTQNLYLLALSDWCNSNASGIREQGVHYGERTDHRRNACYERLTYAVSPDLTDVFPTIPNPVSPWKSVTGTHVWLTACPWGPDAAARDRLLAKFRDRKRRGLTELVVTGHEGMWRDGEESYTFRTEMAPKKGGDAAERAYARALIDELGYFYGPYNNFIDLPPVEDEGTVPDGRDARRPRGRCPLRG